MNDLIHIVKSIPRVTMIEPLLTTSQVAELLNVSTKHVRRLFEKRLIVPVDVGIGRRSFRVAQSELDRFIESKKPPEQFTRRRKYVPKVL
jgi:excisionase family DNA binding protein